MRTLLVSFLASALFACAARTIPAKRDFSAPGAAEIVRGFEIRDRYKLPKHIGPTAIYIDSVSVHHLYSEASTIAWKDDAGEWQWSQAIETGPGGLLAVERKLETNKERPLKPSEAQSVETLINSPGLYTAKVRRTGHIGIGAPYHVMSIVTPYGRTTVKWDGRLRGKTGALADILLGHE